MLRSDGYCFLPTGLLAATTEHTIKLWLFIGLLFEFVLISMQSFKMNVLGELLIQVPWNMAIRKNVKIIINRLILGMNSHRHLH